MPVELPMRRIEPFDVLPVVDLAGVDIERLSDEQITSMLRLKLNIDQYEAGRKAHHIFPDDGPIARHLYPKHMEFFRIGATFRERCFMAANRVGKTVAGSFEMRCHLTGLYPDWWEGRRFTRPIKAWAAGGTNEDTRDIIQMELLGEVTSGHNSGRKSLTGTGMIERDLLDLDRITWKQGVQDLVDTIRVQHVTGGWSTLGFKSYNQGRRSFQGTARHVVWLDEEPPLDVYSECLIRTATTDGIVMLTFTPLEGLSEVVLGFLGENYRPPTDADDDDDL